MFSGLLETAPYNRSTLPTVQCTGWVLKSVLFKTLIYYVNHNQCIQQSSDSESLNQGEFY